MKLAVYGKGGCGKTTVSTNLAVALSKRGKRVLHVGCDPKHDSSVSLCSYMIPTVIDTLTDKDYHYENVWVEDIIYRGFGDVDCVETGGPPAGAGCGGYVVGETVKLLKELNAFYEYDVVLFDVLGDVVCGGFAAPLNYCDYCLAVTVDTFGSVYAANRVIASVKEKARTHPLRIAGFVINKSKGSHVVEEYLDLCPIPILEHFQAFLQIERAKIQAKTFFQLINDSLPFNESTTKGVENHVWKTLCKQYLVLADQLLTRPEGVVPTELSDREFFKNMTNTPETTNDSDNAFSSKTTDKPSLVSAGTQSEETYTEAFWS